MNTWNRNDHARALTSVRTLGALVVACLFALSGSPLLAQASGSDAGGSSPASSSAEPVVQTSAATQAQGVHEATWAEDVMPIFQESCVECHRPNSIAPMSLETYEEAKEYAPLIRFRVANRIMPPWHINPDVGIQEFANDRGLTDAERRTIVQWVDDGAPRGDMSEAPEPRDFPDEPGWRLGDRFGEPDLTVKSEPYDLPAQTQDKWFRPVTPTGLDERKWVRAIEIRPVNPESRTVVHHTLAFLLQEEEEITGLPEAAEDEVTNAGLFMEWAVGKAGQIFRPDAGKLMLPDSRIRWEVHMHASGEPVEDVQVEMGVWFHDTPPEHRTILTMFDARGPNSLDIPPGEVAVTQQSHVLPAPARLENFQPHMHMRGKAMSMEAIYPDGEREVLAFVDNFQWNWQINYVFANDAAPLLPEGTVVQITAWHDNRAENPNNPDPRQWVGWGDRTVDEMAHDWTDVTYLSQEEFERLKAQRQEDRVAAQDAGSEIGADRADQARQDE